MHHGDASIISRNNRPNREKYEWQRPQTECEMRHKMEKKYCFRGGQPVIVQMAQPAIAATDQ